jgi:hypothetical protein
MQSRANSIRTLFLTGCLLIVTIAMILIVSSLAFLAGQGIAGWQFPVSFVLSAGLFFYAGNYRKQHTAIFFRSVLICIAVIIISILIAMQFYDVSYDGQSYHMEGIYQLKNGWNPLKDMLPDSVNMAIFINHYPKGVEIPQSTIYSLTHHIEAGKATNFILLAAAFCLVSSFLLTYKKLSVSKCILITCLFTLNPVIISQLLSTYVDGQLALLLLCFATGAVWLIKDGGILNSILLGSIIIISVNIKFTGLVFIVIFTGALLAWLLILKKKELFRKTLRDTFCCGALALGLVGYNPYIINTFSFSHPFYPVMGEKTVDIMSQNIPAGFEGKNILSKFFISLFAHTDNVVVTNGKKIVLKIPFSFNKNDITSAYEVDIRIAGFGPLFSGILLLSITALLIFLLQPDRQWTVVIKWIYALGFIIFSILIIPEAWWARYVPQLWYIPPVILLMLELYAGPRFKLFIILIYITVIVNISFILLTFRFNYKMTQMVNEQMDKLKSLHKPIAVQWGSAKANRIRFQEHHIPYVEQKLDHQQNVESIICSDTKFRIPVSENKQDKRP